MMLEVDNTPSVTGSDFSQASYRTNNSSVQDFYPDKNFQNQYKYQPQLADDEEEEEESESEESDDSEESEEDEDEDEEYQDQWRQYYQQMYRNSMYMNWMMQMNQMNMNGMNGMGMNGMNGMNGMGMNGMNGMNMPMMNMNGMNSMNKVNDMGMNRMSMNGMNMNMNVNGMNMNGMNNDMNNMNMNNMNMNNMNMNNINNMNNMNNNSNNTNATPNQNEKDPEESQADDTIQFEETQIEETKVEDNEQPEVQTVEKAQVLEESPIKDEPKDEPSQPTADERERYIQKTLSQLSHSSTNNLIKNSRQNTIKSNRFPSFPNNLANKINDIEDQLKDLKIKRNSMSEFELEKTERRNSSSSERSFDSVESEKFNVSRIEEKSLPSIKQTTKEKKVKPQEKENVSPVTPPVKEAKPKTKRKKQKNLTPMNSMNPLTPNQMSPGLSPGLSPGMSPRISPGMNPMSPNMNPMNPGMSPGMHGMNMMNPMMNQMPINPMMMNMSPQLNPQMNYGYNPMMNTPAKHTNLDKDTEDMIERFKNLRLIISKGNKSIEYRYKWVLMLINAVNHKLYNYINIKGEMVNDNISHNKSLFIKSCYQHVLKLIRDITKSSNNEINSEICLLYANLLRHAYLRFDQTFNIEMNIPQAVKYYERAIEYNNLNSKVYYNLGELFEYEDEDIDQAITNYKHSAKLGYNRAIYKMALMYLNIPKIRSVKFIKILNDLSNIDISTTELIDEDKEELKDIIGLSNYELGKVYEGIYPGDLTINDQFIIKCLEIVPVNYSKALGYYNKSAKLSCNLAQVKLGKVYEFGQLNRNMNPNKSIQWYLRSVNHPLSFKRHPESMIGLSRWCIKGTEGLSKHIPNANPERAVKWCSRAIREFGTSESYFQMGKLAELGLSPKPSKYWYTKAAKLGHLQAQELLNQSSQEGYQQGYPEQEGHPQKGYQQGHPQQGYEGSQQPLEGSHQQGYEGSQECSPSQSQTSFQSSPQPYNPQYQQY
ncbi:hypothetical protein CLIB1444_06S06326 [[Candida] jaroonii]|uniref:Uncharacterized protein n=1 Tax=[Candida] jaroonii TaxID=467808 RepID=A0ACA9YB19_9ASCO|nr:hypothetical protein CLIB1444_06S06326 [[Candida] jaroonii]